MLYIMTGATGWLGRRVLRTLTEGNSELGDAGRGGHRVRVLAQASDDVRDLHSTGAEVVFGDVRDKGPTMPKLFLNAEGGILIHLAGIIHPSHGTREFTAVNVEGTRNVVEAATRARVGRIVAMSSNSPIGYSKNPVELFDEESRYDPYMGYGRSKCAMEQWLRKHGAIAESPGITIVRAPWFYGPGQPQRQTAFFSMIRRGTFPLMGRGLARRSMGYVDSLTSGILLAASSLTAAGATYWLADERPYAMREIVSTVRTVFREDFGMKVRPTTLHVPGTVADAARMVDWALQAVGWYNQRIHVLSEMNLTIACAIDKAKRELGYRPLVDLREGMRRSIEWCLAQNIAL